MAQVLHEVGQRMVVGPRRRRRRRRLDARWSDSATAITQDAFNTDGE